MNVTTYGPFTQVTADPLMLNGHLAAIPDRVYPLDGQYVAFDVLELCSNLDDQTLYDYRGAKLRICYFREQEQIGMLVDQHGPRGPVTRIKGVLAKVEQRP